VNPKDWNREAVGCSLSDEEFRERVRFIHELTERALISREPQSGGGMLFRFRSSPDNEAAVRELVALESECCPNLRFDLDAGGDEICLEVSQAA
jgi:hypothetical protein